jgi:sterol desaturase/sphingolipid hydroxylase (fatty acid hydroxylase superfamily)
LEQLTNVTFIFFNLTIFLLALVFSDKNPNRLRWSWLLVYFINFFLACFILALLLPVATTWFAWHEVLTLGNTHNAWYPYVIAFFAFSFIDYWMHRLLHASKFLWRHIHSLHHDTPVMNVLVFSYLHPFDVFLRVGASNCILLFVLGLTPTQIATAVMPIIIIGGIQHSNIRCPKWLDYVIMTPRMHKEHHRKNYNTSNFGVIALWDQLFRTVRYPVKAATEFGFETFSAKHTLSSLLLFRSFIKSKKTHKKIPGVKPAEPEYSLD